MVTTKPITENCQPIIIGLRVRAELERRAHELANRFRPSPRDLRELADIRELLKATPGKGDRHEKAVVGSRQLLTSQAS